ncbi:thioredoxin [Candidatus Curtissbacteria bacterium]|nr:thioredoxin [Candidatus Curtissbacteria bacterium]
MIKLLDFWATWCGPCKFMEPIIEELEKELSGKIQIQKIDVDQEQDLAAKYQVMSIPTYVVEKDGKEVDRIIGATSKDTLLAALTKNE